MMKAVQQTENHLKKKHITYMGGPILFTAPHSKRLMRGGQLFKQKKRIHYRQTYTSWIVLRLAQLTKLNKNQLNSFCFWGKSSQIREQDMDPNYLLPSMVSDSQFHQSLHAWGLKHHGKPILHVDIHGKLNRKNDCEIQIGIQSVRWHWKGDPLISMFEKYFQNKMSNLFQGYNFKEFKCLFNTDPCLHGLWPGDMQTMTEQAIKLGIPSCQFQIPNQVRKKLFKDQNLMNKFSDAIRVFYIQAIVPYYDMKLHPLKLSNQLAIKFQVTIHKKQIEELENQVKRLETRQQSDLNLKKI